MTCSDVKHCVECLQANNNTLTCFATTWMDWTESGPQTCLRETKAGDLIEACQYRVPFVKNNVRRFWKTTEQRRAWMEKKATWNGYCIFANGLALNTSEIFIFPRAIFNLCFVQSLHNLYTLFKTKKIQISIVLSLACNLLEVSVWQETSAQS